PYQQPPYQQPPYQQPEPERQRVNPLQIILPIAAAIGVGILQSKQRDRWEQERHDRFEQYQRQLEAQRRAYEQQNGQYHHHDPRRWQ
ncbi:MAG: hypothetical protein JWM80_6306, partial [Cyanobacteria bacterium RYN_339]|nr:hypothetical protein [Cyanobacteria bacterium RYN_339]